MAKSKKPKASQPEATATPSSPAVDPNLALFASYVEDDRKKAQAAKRAAKEQRRQAQEAQNLVDAKNEAAAEVKRIRSRGGATPEERAAAETAYREALGAVVAAETGETPAWAPDDPGDAVRSNDGETDPEAQASPEPEEPAIDSEIEAS